jgi:tetratricopeptide (TPR) repeat protein
MIGKTLRALGAAFLVGTASVAIAGVATTQMAQAGTVRPAVGKPLQEALDLAKDGKINAALAKVKEAESVSDLTSAERDTIAQMKNYILAKSGDPSVYENMIASGQGSAAVAKELLSAHYNARQYGKVIQDEEVLRRFSALDAQSQMVIAQAYYLSGNYSGAIKYLHGIMGGGGTQQQLELLMNCASKVGDEDSVRTAAERLILQGKPQYWVYFLGSADRTKGLSDHQTLDIYRLRLMTGSMRNADDYSLATQLAIQMGFPAEAQAIQQKGFDTKALSGARQQRLLDMAKTQATQTQTGLAKTAAAAAKAPTGEPLVKLGEAYWGMGRYQDSLNAVQAGIQKGVTDKNTAEMALGFAYVGLKNFPQAAKAFAAADGNGAAQVISRLWSVYARSH